MLLSRHLIKVQTCPIDMKSLKDLHKQKNIDQNCKQPSRELNDKYNRRFLEKLEIHVFSSISSSFERHPLLEKNVSGPLFPVLPPNTH